MDTMRKYLIISGAGIIGIGILLMIKASHHHDTGMCESVGKSLDEKLRDSKDALDKASAHVQSVFEQIKNHH